MSKFSYFFLVFLVLFDVTACNVSYYKQDLPNVSCEQKKTDDPSGVEIVKQKIYAEYQGWRGTRYVYGGNTKRGVDCSGLVYQIYYKQFGLVIPRTTKLLSKTGERVQHNQLRPGDLVFFKTGLWKRHVGIYIEKGNFLHASSKHGVMISNLQQYYWKDRYRQARRILL